MADTEKSGIEMLEEILNRMYILEQKLDILDRNIKIIMNNTKKGDHQPKLSAVNPVQETKPVKEPIKEMVADPKQTSGFKNFKMEMSDASKMNTGEVLAQRQRAPVKNIVVKGKMVLQDGGKLVPLSNISVKVYNDKDILVKETRTNRAGHWVSHLPSGKYVANFSGENNGKKLVEINKNFIVPETLSEGQLEFEVV